MQWRTPAPALVLLVLLMSTTGCGDVVETRGSGNVITETREVSGFDEIVLAGSGEVVVDIDGTESVVIEAEDNLMPLIETEVRNGRLELGMKSSASITKEIRYTISAIALEGLSIAGSGKIIATNLEPPAFAADISGSGQIVASGTTADLFVEISGSGVFAGENLVSETGRAKVSGSGIAVVHVTGELDATVSGSGRVEYLGSPTLDKSVSGSGEVREH